MMPRSIQDLIRDERAHFLIVEGGTLSFAVCDDRSPGPAVVFCTREAAEHAIDLRVEAIFQHAEKLPRRIQLKRTKGWRKPENTVVVARPSKWGNLWRVGFVACGCRSAGECDHNRWRRETAAGCTPHQAGSVSGQKTLRMIEEYSLERDQKTAAKAAILKWNRATAPKKKRKS